MGKIYRHFTENKLAWLIVLFGIVCRASQFLFNRSLWADEAIRALEFKKYSFVELLQLKGFVTTQVHAAPYGFLIIQKLLSLLLGDSEYALRFFPFICGVLSLFALKKIVKWFVPTKASLVALALFATSHHLIFYSSEIKPYSSDVLITLLIFILMKYIHLKPISFFKMIMTGIGGGACIWFSFPSVFFLAGGGCALIADKVRNRDRERLLYTVGICAIWLMNFLICYVINLKHFANEPNLLEYWGNSFVTFSWQGFNLFYESFRNPVGLFFPLLGLMLFLLGGYFIFTEQKTEGAILVLPIVFTLIASMLMLYPFTERVILFLIPSYLLLIAKGFEVFEKVFSGRRKIILTGILLLLIPSYAKSVYHLVEPRENEEIRPVMAYLKQNYRPGDLLYVYYGAAPAFEYYSGKLNLDTKNSYSGIASRKNEKQYLSDMAQFQGRQRVWFLFSHCYKNEKYFFVYNLEQIGKRLDAYEAVGSAVYLYDLGAFTRHSVQNAVSTESRQALK